VKRFFMLTRANHYLAMKIYKKIVKMVYQVKLRKWCSI